MAAMAAADYPAGTTDGEFKRAKLFAPKSPWKLSQFAAAKAWIFDFPLLAVFTDADHPDQSGAVVIRESTYTTPYISMFKVGCTTDEDGVTTISDLAADDNPTSYLADLVSLRFTTRIVHSDW